MYILYMCVRRGCVREHERGEGDGQMGDVCEKEHTGLGGFVCTYAILFL